MVRLRDIHKVGDQLVCSAYVEDGRVGRDSAKLDRDVVLGPTVHAQRVNLPFGGMALSFYRECSEP